MYFYQVIDSQNAQTEQKSEYIYSNGRKVTEAAMDQRSCCYEGQTKLSRLDVGQGFSIFKT